MSRRTALKGISNIYPRDVFSRVKPAAKKLRRFIAPFLRRICSVLKSLRVRIKKLFRSVFYFVYQTLQIYLDNNVPRSAAQFSFNIIFSLFPLLICIHWFIGVLHLNYDSLFSFLGQFFPESTITILSDYIDYVSSNQSNAALLAGIVMLLTPASAALRSLQYILNEIHNRRRKTTVLSFLFSFVTTVVFLIVVYVCIFVLFSGNWLLNYLVRRFNLNEFILDWNWLRFIVFFVIVSLMLYSLYRFVPYTGRRRPEIYNGYIMPGAVFSSVTLVVVSIVFSYFISYSSRYSLVYGSLASIIILMLWLYVCSNIIIIGGIINRLCDLYAKGRKGNGGEDDPV